MAQLIDKTRIPRILSRGISYVEICVVAAISIPLIYVLWTNRVLTRRAETGTVSIASAARGACLFETYLRRDLASMNQSLGTECFRLNDDGSFSVFISVPDTGPHLLEKRETRYEFLPYGPAALGAFAVLRDGHIIQQVVIRHFAARWESSGIYKWLSIDFETLDPGLGRTPRGTLYSYTSSILAALSWTPSTNRLVDYSTTLPVQPALSAWVEGSSQHYIYLAGYNASNPSTPTTFAMTIDSDIFDLPPSLLSPVAEITGYWKVEADYPQLLSTCGPGYPGYDVGLLVAPIPGSPETGRREFWHEHVFYPSHDTNFQDDEASIDWAVFRRDLPGQVMEIWLHGSQPGRPYYMLESVNSAGQTTQISAIAVGGGLYHALFTGLTKYTQVDNTRIY